MILNNNEKKPLDWLIHLGTLVLEGESGMPKTHKHYDKTVYDSRDFTSFATGENQEELLAWSFPSECEDGDIVDRFCITKPVTPILIDKYEKKMQRVHKAPMIDESLTLGNEQQKSKVEEIAKNIFKGQSISKFLQLALSKDELKNPNGFYLFDLIKAKETDLPVFQVKKIDECDAINYEYNYQNLLDFLLTKGEEKYFYYYFSGHGVKFRYVTDKKKTEDVTDGVEQLQLKEDPKIIRFQSFDDKGDVAKEVFLEMVYVDGYPESVPAIKISNIYDADTSGETALSVLHPYRFLVEKIIIHNSNYDVIGKKYIKPVILEGIFDDEEKGESKCTDGSCGEADCNKCNPNGMLMYRSKKTNFANHSGHPKYKQYNEFLKNYKGKKQKESITNRSMQKTRTMTFFSTDDLKDMSTSRMLDILYDEKRPPIELYDTVRNHLNELIKTFIDCLCGTSNRKNTSGSDAMQTATEVNSAEQNTNDIRSRYCANYERIYTFFYQSIVDWCSVMQSGGITSQKVNVTLKFAKNFEEETIEDVVDLRSKAFAAGMQNSFLELVDTKGVNKLSGDDETESKWLEAFAALDITRGTETATVMLFDSNGKYQQWESYFIGRKAYFFALLRDKYKNNDNQFLDKSISEKMQELRTVVEDEMGKADFLDVAA